MTFKASKTRAKKVELLAEGTQLIPSSAIRVEYEKGIKTLIKAMADDYHREYEKMIEEEAVQAHFAQDGVGNHFKKFFARMQNRWANFFEEKSGNLAQKFAVKVDQHSFTTVARSMKALGIKAPREVKPDLWADTMQIYVQQNVGLIKTIGSEFHDKIEKAAWNSLTSPEGREQGTYGIVNKIKEVMGDEFGRAELIARDQNSKLYSVLNNARMEQNGVNQFKWFHSSAAKKPRECHVEWNDQVFLTKGGPNELYWADGRPVTVGGNVRKADIGKPGFPIHCGCRSIAVIDLD